MKRQGSVRMLGLFGQDEQEKTGLSPNTRLIRTGCPGNRMVYLSSSKSQQDNKLLSPLKHK
jgi:hypothetical protein